MFPDHTEGIQGQKEEKKIMYTLTYHEFAKALATAKDLVRCTSFLFDLTEELEITPEIYAKIVILHNSAVDYIEAMENIKEKEE